MNVVFLARRPFSSPRGGGERYDFEVCRRLRELGHHVRILTLDDMPLLMRNPLCGAAVLAFKIFTGRYSVIIEDMIMHPYCFLLNRVLTTLLCKKVIVMAYHPYHQQLSHGLLRFLDRSVETFNIRGASLVVAISNTTREWAIGSGVKRDTVKVVYPGFDRILPGRLESPNIDGSGAVRLLFVGEVRPRKGLEYLIEAVAMLKDMDIFLSIVGDLTFESDYYEALRGKARELEIEERVLFLGRVPSEELTAQYRSADIFILSSLLEGFGIVLLEAMSFGLPIIATKAGSIPELVEDGINGFLVDRASSVGLARAIKKLISDPALKKKMSVANLEKVERFDSWDEAALKVCRAIEAVVCAAEGSR
ncbi:MAG: glycosyltransferase family 4 protein [Candidatus Tritonobacter lacicola]|nr:glycosyltransferase family 4 protein [Candidatus Tritonobacter lacicola]